MCYIPPGAQASRHLTKADSVEDWAGSAVVAAVVWAVVVSWAAATESAPAKMRVVKKRMVAGMAAAWRSWYCEGGLHRYWVYMNKYTRQGIIVPKNNLTASERPGERKEGDRLETSEEKNQQRGRRRGQGGYNEQKGGEQDTSRGMRKA